jgi:PAS domain S-box-containing protein
VRPVRKVIRGIVLGLAAAVSVGPRRDSTARSTPETAGASPGRLSASEQSLSAVVETSVDGIVVIDEQGRIELFNPASERLFGYPAEEVLGRNVSVLMPEPFRSEHPAYVERYVRTGEAHIVGIAREVVGLRKDGTTFAFELSVSEARLEDRRLFVGIVRDITERRREEQLRLVLEGVGTGTWRQDLATGTIEWSDTMGPILGLPAGAGPATHEQLVELVHPEDREALEAAVERAAVAGLDFDLEFRTCSPGETVRWLETRAHVLRDGHGSPTALIGLTQDITERKKGEEQQRLLAEASSLLSSTADYREALQELARVVAASLADWCAVHVLDPDAGLQRVALAHADPERTRLAAESASRFPPDPEARYGPASVIRTGRPEIYPTVPDTMLADLARDAEHLELLKSLGLRSAIVAPIVLRSRPFGAITLVSAESRRTYGQGDLAFVEELARRAALAADNALMHEDERRARAEAQTAAGRAQRLQSLVASLAEAATSEEIAHVLVREGAAALEADAGLVYLVDESTGELRLVAQDGYPRWFVTEFGRIPLSATNATAQTARERQPRWFSNVDEHRGAHPDLAAAFEALGYRALAYLPLATGSRVLGAVSFAFSASRSFAADEREHLTALAGQCALAVERARLYEREHRIAVALQQSLLPRRLPAVEGVALAVRYLPGSRALEVGGDWFDAIPLPGGRLAVSIGDVVGRGVHAAAAMAQLRTALRAYALEGLSPATALSRLDAYTEQLGERDFATALCLELDPSSGKVQYANAGHLPPLLVAGGSASLLEGARSVPIGVETEIIRPEEAFELEPGSTVVLYTDGLVERRSFSLVEGLGKLTRAAAGASPGPHELLEHLLEELGARHPSRHDDIAVLAVHLEPQPAHRLELDLDASPAGLTAARLRMRRWLAELDLDPAELTEILVACGEACSNAIHHPRDPSSRSVHLQACVAGGQLELRLRGTGSRRAPRGPDGGLGLPLTEQLMDEVGVSSSGEGTEVLLRRRLHSLKSERLPG